MIFGCRRPDNHERSKETSLVDGFMGLDRLENGTDATHDFEM